MGPLDGVSVSLGWEWWNNRVSKPHWLSLGNVCLLSQVMFLVELNKTLVSHSHSLNVVPLPPIYNAQELPEQGKTQNEDSCSTRSVREGMKFHVS